MDMHCYTSILIATCQSCGGHTLKHTLIYWLFYAKWDKMNSCIEEDYKPQTRDHKPMREMFAEVAPLLVGRKNAGLQALLHRLHFFRPIQRYCPGSVAGKPAETQGNYWSGSKNSHITLHKTEISFMLQF